jgi:predicted 2-oxoglutarate/Fe(II)-dependent dioxygenase YbiX
MEIARPRLKPGESVYVHFPVFDTCILPTPDEDPSVTWLYNRVEHLMQRYNDKVDFYVDGLQDALGVSRYKTGHSMARHNDYNITQSAKISASILLNDDYEGGDLVIDSEKLDPMRRPLRRGDGIAFASFESHTVEEVTKGERWVLLGWFSGPRFR